MMPLSPQLQQHWQTVADRLPTDFPVAELSPQARSVMAFSDFGEQSVIAKPGCRSACRPSLTKRG